MLNFYRPLRLLIVFVLFFNTVENSQSKEKHISTVFPVIDNEVSCGLNFSILDNSCTPSSYFNINVNSALGSQLGQDVILEEVRIIVAHNWDADMDISLSSPSGKVVNLSSDNGGGGNNYGDPNDLNCTQYTAFSMNACQSIEEGAAPFIGTYFPEGNFIDFNDNSDPNGNWILRLCDDAPNDLGILKYVELIFTNILCPAPIDLTVDSINSNQASLSWTAGTSCLAAVLEYGPPGFIPGNNNLPGQGTVIDLPCPITIPFEIYNLQELSDYDVYIRESCSVGVYSENGCAASFRTSCQTLPITIRDDFDTLVTCPTSCGTTCAIAGTWRNVSNDDQDWLIDKDGTTSTNTGPSDDITGGGNYLYIETSGGACQNDKSSVLESQCIGIDAVSGVCHLSFYYHLFGIHVNQLELEISIDGGNSWVGLWSEAGEQGDQWIQQFIDLSNYHNQVALFRFIGTSGNGFRGDIGLDQIEFYGGINLGLGNNTYYADLDQDGYGDINNFLTLCTNNTPSNYVTNKEDCDDSNPMINPAFSEIPCNQIDENCNGDTDDLVLNMPEVNGDTICVGDQTTITIDLIPVGNYYWYDSPQGGNFLSIGNSFTTSIISSSTIFYVQDSILNSCASNRTPVWIEFFTEPDIFSPVQPTICQGSTYDLLDLNIVDANLTNGNLSFHSDIPTTGSNQLNSSMVTLDSTQLFYARWETLNGCFDEISIPINVLIAPSVYFQPSSVLEVCPNSSVDISIQPPPNSNYTYLWDNGDPTPYRTFQSSNSGTQNIYALTITDELGCTKQELIEVITVAGVNNIAVIGVEAVTTCGGNDGSIELSPIDGTAPFHYKWSGPSSGNLTAFNNNFLLNFLPQGNYRITITDSSPLACQVVLPAFIINGPSAVIDTIINVTAVTCFAGSNGAIDITVSGTAPNYEWSNGATTQDIINVPAGNYSVTITDGICSNTLDDIVVSTPTNIEFFPAIIGNVSCTNGFDGTIEVNLTGGTPPYQFQWSNGATEKIVNNLTAGSYEVTVTDTNNCSMIATDLTVIEPLALAIDLISSTAPTCFSGNDGALQIAVNGGVAPYLYEWNTGSQTKNLQDLSDGIYYLTITDNNNCTKVSGLYTVNEPSELAFDQITILPTSCNGINDGACDIEISGGTPPYEYNWSNGSNEEDLDTLPSGIYSVTIIDANGCTLISSTLELIAPEVLQIDAIGVIEQSCEGVSDGQINIDIAGGTLPYLFTWSNGLQVEDLQGLISGDYQLTVMDASGCMMVTPIYEVEVIEALATEIDLVDPVNCAGESNGRIFIDPPGLGPYVYQWSNGAQTEDLQNLPAGDYTLTMTDPAGCLLFLDPITIAEPEPIDIQIAAAENVTCHGLEDGSIAVDITGGIPPYIYSWSNGWQTEDLSSVPVGNYQLTLLDANNCIIDGPMVIISQPEPIEIEVVEIIDVGCAGNESGSIDIDVLGGFSPYEYSWSNGSINPNISNLAPGKYDVTIHDENGCSNVLLAVEVKQLIEELNVTPTLETGLSCFDDANGWISVEVDGGAAPFQYNWSNGVLDSINTNLPEGIYNVTITDKNGCVGVSSWIELEAPEELVFQVSAIGGVTCANSNDGFINLEINGGTAPYFVSWNNGDTTQNIIDLPIGEYTITIEDAMGCFEISTQSISIEAPINTLDLLSVNLINSIDCEEGTGSISLFGQGGTPPYSYLWNNGSTENFIDQLSSGIYNCTITDASSCAYETSSFVIEEPINFQLNTISTPAIGSTPNGTATVEVIGGQWPFTFFWDEQTGSQQDSIALDLLPGNYEVIVIDANGCEKSTIVEVETLTSLDQKQEVLFQIFPNPTSGKIYLNSSTQSFDHIQYEIFTIQGQKVDTHSIDNTNQNTLLYDFKNQPSGVYLIKISINQKQVFFSRLIVTGNLY